ncbi:hypothetical protein PV326_013094, partial [Microctonus aethiopoides]
LSENTRNILSLDSSQLLLSSRSMPCEKFKGHACSFDVTITIQYCNRKDKNIVGRQSVFVMLNDEESELKFLSIPNFKSKFVFYLHAHRNSLNLNDTPSLIRSFFENSTAPKLKVQPYVLR